MARRLFQSLVICYLVTGCTLVPPTARPTPERQQSQPKFSTPELLDLARSRNQISESQRILYLAYAVYEYDSLPVQFQSDIPWQGSRIVAEIKGVIASTEKMCVLEVEVQEELRRVIPSGVTCPTFTEAPKEQ